MIRNLIEKFRRKQCPLVPLMVNLTYCGNKLSNSFDVFEPMPTSQRSYGQKFRSPTTNISLLSSLFGSLCLAPNDSSALVPA